MVQRKSPIFAQRIVVSEPGVDVVELLIRDLRFKLFAKEVAEKRMVSVRIRFSGQPAEKHIFAERRLKLFAGDVQSQRFIQYFVGQVLRQ